MKQSILLALALSILSMNSFAHDATNPRIDDIPNIADVVVPYEMPLPILIATEQDLSKELEAQKDCSYFSPSVADVAKCKLDKVRTNLGIKF